MISTTDKSELPLSTSIEKNVDALGVEGKNTLSTTYRKFQHFDTRVSNTVKHLVVHTNQVNVLLG